jgi:hypothetical protein
VHGRDLGPEPLDAHAASAASGDVLANPIGNFSVQSQRQQFMIFRALVERHQLDPPKARSAQNVLIRYRIRYTILRVIRLWPGNLSGFPRSICKFIRTGGNRVAAP